jgi:hypothetical protein
MFFESKCTTMIVLLANAYIEVVCINPWLPPILRKWSIVRTVNYEAVDI